MTWNRGDSPESRRGGIQLLSPTEQLEQSVRRSAARPFRVPEPATDRPPIAELAPADDDELELPPWLRPEPTRPEPCRLTSEFECVTVRSVPRRAPGPSRGPFVLALGVACGLTVAGAQLGVRGELWFLGVGLFAMAGISAMFALVSTRA